MKMDNNCIIFDSKQSDQMKNYRISGKQVFIAITKFSQKT